MGPPSVRWLQSIPPPSPKSCSHPRRRCAPGIEVAQNPYFKHYDGAAVSPQDNFLAEHSGVSSLVINPEHPKLKLDERDGPLSQFENQII
jgi:hypothetical protein